MSPRLGEVIPQLLHPRTDLSAAPSPPGRARPQITWRHELAAIVAGGMVYGLALGTFGGLAPERLLQPIFAALKVPLLLLVSTLLTLPGLLVFNSVAGLRNDLPHVLRAIGTSQAAASLVLASLAPYTLFWYAHHPRYHHATLFNGVMFAIASLAGYHVLRRQCVPLVARDPRHRWQLRGWLVLYVFVAIQCSWIFRPFLGDPARPVQFLRADAWGNAYVELGETLTKGLLRRGRR